MKLNGLKNPVWRRSDNLRDPAVLPTGKGYYLYYSRFSNNACDREENWAVASVFTRDFVSFSDDRDISPKGFASPEAPVMWHGRYLLPYQSYPVAPARLCFSESADALRWSDPQFFLPEVGELMWNTRKRAIDPSFVVEGEHLHCFFVGSCDTETKGRHANLLGHAVTRDPSLRSWEILTVDKPLIGRSARAYDGVENVTVFKTEALWNMIYSEGLEKQHLAYAQSADLMEWVLKGPIIFPTQSWMSVKHGAPFVWRDEGMWLMILMGTDATHHTSLGLLSSPDGVGWTALPEG